MPVLRWSTDGNIRLRGEVPFGSSQPRGQEDVASDENRARLWSWQTMAASQTSFPSGGIVVAGLINLIGKFRGNPRSESTGSDDVGAIDIVLSHGGIVLERVLVGGDKRRSGVSSAPLMTADLGGVAQWRLGA